MKKEDILKELENPKGITGYEAALLKRLDALIEVLADIRNSLNNGKE